MSSLIVRAPQTRSTIESGRQVDLLRNAFCPWNCRWPNAFSEIAMARFEPNRRCREFRAVLHRTRVDLIRCGGKTDSSKTFFWEFLRHLARYGLPATNYDIEHRAKQIAHPRARHHRCLASSRRGKRSGRYHNHDHWTDSGGYAIHQSTNVNCQ